MSWERKVQKKSSWSSSTLSPRESLFKTQGFSKPVEEPVEKIALKPIQFRGRDTSHLDHIKVNTNRPIVTPRVNLSNLQTKLTVGAPGDKYEQEADSMAQKVMSTPDSAVQRMTPGEEDEVRTKPLAENITPLVQREEMPHEEEKELQAKPLVNGLIQREEMPEEEKELQAKPLGNGIIQCEEMPEEKKEVQAKLLGNGTIQREEMPEEQEIQTKPLLQRTIDGSLQAGGNIESRLNSSKGGGSPLGDEARSFMEPRFGTDFSSVRVHTGSEAVQMNRELGAQAFTHGSDVYFGAGKTPGNNELTAHELTHVVQQTGLVQTKNTSKTIVPRKLGFITMKRKNIELAGRDKYGHWWTEIDGKESYGWWPKYPVGFKDTMLGVEGELNGMTSFGGSPTRDPHHGHSAPDSFHPVLKDPTKTNAQVEREIRTFASSYSGEWRWSVGFGQNCHTFQESLMDSVGLEKP